MWQTRKPDLRMVLHGYLYAAGFDDHRYQISGAVDPKALRIEAIDIIRVPFSVPDGAKVKCADGARRSVEALLAIQSQGGASGRGPSGPFTLTDVKLQETYTWAAAPSDGFGYYFVSAASADGYECIFHIEMGILSRGNSWDCRFSKAHFNYCAN
jgi:hypothetical protein